MTRAAYAAVDELDLPGGQVASVYQQARGPTGVGLDAPAPVKVQCSATFRAAPEFMVVTPFGDGGGMDGVNLLDGDASSVAEDDDIAERVGHDPSLWFPTPHQGVHAHEVNPRGRPRPVPPEFRPP
jgi:hypothetical protein